MPDNYSALDIRLPILVSDTPTGKVTGWAALSTDDAGRPIYDHEGHHIPASELEAAVHKAFTETSGRGAVGDMHERAGIGDLVESFVLDAEKRKALGLPPGREGWLVTVDIKDPDALKDVLAGNKAEFSLRGWATLVPDDNGSQVRDLRLNVAELVSIVDAGASGSAVARPQAVLIKRALDKGCKPREMRKMPMSPEDRAAALEGLRARLSEEDQALLAMLLESVAAPPPAVPAPEPVVQQVSPQQDQELPMTPTPQVAEEPKPVVVVQQEVAEEEEKEEEMAKALKASPMLAKRLRRSERQASELAKRLAHLEDERGQQVMLEKVRKDMPNVPGASSEEVAFLVKRARDALDDQEVQILKKVLRASSQVVAKSGLMQPVGAGGESSASGGYAKLQELAKRHAREHGTSYHKAMIAVSTENPDLYAEARAESAR